MRRPPAKVRCRGRQYDVQRTVTLRGRPYWVTATLGNRQRRKLQVFDPAAQDLRIIHVLPRTVHTRQQLRVLRRANRINGFPTIIDVDQRRDEVWVMTDWVWGEPLAGYLAQARRGHRPWPSAHTAWTLFARFVHGLSQFHDFTMCAHGDIKCDNLIVQAESQKLRLIDFGSAWNEEAAMLRSPGDGHTLGYAAPELHVSGHATQLADQFSATVVLYEMVTGELPYDGMGGRAGWPDFQQAFGDGFEAPSGKCQGNGTLPKQVWQKIDAIAKQGLAIDPNDRFPTSNAWRDAVDQVSLKMRQATAEPSWQQAFMHGIDRLSRLWSPHS